MNKDIPVPARMQRLPVDPRGYPVPWIVQMGNGGTPHFIINDSLKRARCVEEDRCGICGNPLMRGRWFAGGPASAFHPNGAYIDPPMHKECMEYAMQVCPYIAMPNYNALKMHNSPKRLEKPADLADHVILVDETMVPGRPAVFVAVHARATRQTANGYLVPAKPYIDVQFWRYGKRLTETEAREFGI
jgi:hypothetical protein